MLVENRGFVAWFVGAEQQLNGTLLPALTVNALLRQWNQATVAVLHASARHDRLLACTSLADWIVTTVATIVLVRSVGSPAR